ncbi:transposase [Streptacidiphilus sp. MAP12-16]
MAHETSTTDWSMLSRIWVGADCGRTHHHCLVMDAEGNTLLSRRVLNDEAELLELIGDILEVADNSEVTWTLDMTGGEPALLIALLVSHGEKLQYIPGIAVSRATDSYRGQGKTDARDARVIADQGRMRRDLHPIRPGDEAAIELRLLTDRRADLAKDRTRTINRCRALMNSMFPGLERVLDLGTVGALVLLTGYQTPAALRRIGVSRLTTWLRNRRVYNAGALAARVVEAAGHQQTSVAGEKAIAMMVHTLAKEVTLLNEKIAETDKLIQERFRQHELAEIVQSMPGIGPLLGAEFLAGIGGDLDAFPSPDRLAAFAGLSPAPSGLRQSQRQPPPPHALPPPPATRLLRPRADQHPMRSELAEVLRP